MTEVECWCCFSLGLFSLLGFHQSFLTKCWTNRGCLEWFMPSLQAWVTVIYKINYIISSCLTLYPMAYTHVICVHRSLILYLHEIFLFFMVGTQMPSGWRFCLGCRGQIFSTFLNSGFLLLVAVLILLFFMLLWYFIQFHIVEIIIFFNFYLHICVLQFYLILKCVFSGTQAWQCTSGKEPAWNLLSLFTTSGMLFLEISLVAFLLQGNYASGLEALMRTFVISGIIVAGDIFLKVAVSPNKTYVYSGFRLSTLNFSCIRQTFDVTLVSYNWFWQRTIQLCLLVTRLSEHVNLYLHGNHLTYSVSTKIQTCPCPEDLSTIELIDCLAPSTSCHHNDSICTFSCFSLSFFSITQVPEKKLKKRF